MMLAHACPIIRSISSPASTPSGLLASRVSMTVPSGDGRSAMRDGRTSVPAGMSTRAMRDSMCLLVGALANDVCAGTVMMSRRWRSAAARRDIAGGAQHGLGGDGGGDALQDAEHGDGDGRVRATRRDCYTAALHNQDVGGATVRMIRAVSCAHHGWWCLSAPPV